MACVVDRLNRYPIQSCRFTRNKTCLSLLFGKIPIPIRFAMSDSQYDLTRIVFAVLFLGMLIALSLWILRPFLVAFMWATTIVVATWPIMKIVQTRLGGKRY